MAGFAEAPGQLFNATTVQCQSEFQKPPDIPRN